MVMTLTTPNTLLGTMLSKAPTKQMVNTFAVVMLGTLLLTLSAKVNIPFIPVPATFQTLVVAALAAAFGWRIGVATVALYLTEGALGLPVFSAGGGAAYLLGPTGGFLVGFLPAAYIVGMLADAGASKKFLPMFGAMLLGDVVLFTFGIAWLTVLAGNASWIDQTNVLGSIYTIAVKPFIVWDVLKMAFAALTVVGGWQLLKSRKG